MSKNTWWRRKPLMLASAIWLVLIVVLTALAPLIAPYGPTEQNLMAVLQGPSAEHLLGTDNLGRDTLSRILYGGQVTLLSVLLATSVALVLGSLLGVISGYVGRWVDTLLTAIADILMSIPTLVILLAIAAVTGRNNTVVMVSIGILLSASVFRVVRAATLELRGELFVTAARTSGLGGFAILVRHIIPRLGSVILIQAAVIASLALVVQVGLGFLGIDVEPPAPSWGNMVASASQTIYTSAWPLIAPAVVIIITVLAFSLLGDGAQQLRTARGRRQISLRNKKMRTRGQSPSAVLPALETSADSDEEPLLSLRNLSVRVNPQGRAPVKLIDDVSIEVYPGEIVGLVGESGAGKSVTARAVLGLAPRDLDVTGSVRYRGIEMLDAPDDVLRKIRGKQIAFIGQDPMMSLSPTVRLGAQLAEAVRRHRGVGRKEAERITLELLELVRIVDPKSVARLYPHQISGGMAQRVVIAMALAGEPSLIIADEPTTALDVSVQMQILELLRTLQAERSLAMVIVTHDWGVVADICNRAVVMYAGQVVEESPVRDLFAHSAHPYSTALRAADPHLQTGGTRLRTIAGQVPPPGDWPVGCRFSGRCAFRVDACDAAPIELLPYGEHRSVRCIRADREEGDHGRHHTAPESRVAVDRVSG